MFNRIMKPKRKNNDEEVSYWLSYSDLMASVLIIFILLFTYKILDYNQALESKESQIEELTKIRDTIIGRLLNEFGNEIDVDSKTGVIKLRSNILFDVDQSYIKEEGRQFLQGFIPRYLKVLLGDEEIKDNISRIVIEGHTDDDGDYLYNLNLSQERAFNVVNLIYSDEVDSIHKEELKEYIAAIGRSKVDLIKDSDGTVLKDESRRVEFKFELKDERIIQAILEEVKRD